MKKVVLMHGKDTDSQGKWYPWFGNRVSKLGYEYVAPDLPSASDPDIEEWTGELDKITIDSETILVGHSRGGVAILRWLEKQPANFSVDRVVLVATNSGLLTDRYIESETNHGFYTEVGYDFEKIKTHCSDFVVMHSTDDSTVPYENGVKNAIGLGARLETYNNKRHFGTGYNGVMQKEIPEILEVIMEQTVPYPLSIGHYVEQDFKIEVVEQEMELPEVIEEMIEQNWVEKTKLAQEKGQRMFNGFSYRVVSHNTEGNKIELDLALFDFRHRYGVICIAKESGVQIQHNGTFVGSSVRTKDNYYVMVKLSGKSMNTNNYDLLGGMVETETDFTGSSFLFDVLYQEMQEEGGIERQDVKSCEMRMMYQGEYGHVGFYFETDLKITKADLESRFENNSDQDIESLVFFNQEEYEQILESHNPNKQLILKVFRGELK